MDVASEALVKAFPLTHRNTEVPGAQEKISFGSRGNNFHTDSMKIALQLRKHSGVAISTAAEK